MMFVIFGCSALHSASVVPSCCSSRSCNPGGMPGGPPPPGDCAIAVADAAVSAANMANAICFFIDLSFLNCLKTA
jgi:hypothetical protein